MIILGVTHPIALNPGACILVDGKLLAMAEEERFCRIKHAPRRFPALAMTDRLKQAGVLLDEVDAVGIGFEGPLKTMWDSLVNHPLAFGLPMAASMGFDNALACKKIPAAILAKKPFFIDHHLCHANSAFYCSPVEDAAILSVDGTGGGSSGLIGHGRGGRISVFHRISNLNSLGYLYTMVTKALGFRPHADESKVMGLAYFGTPDPGGLPFLVWDRPLI